MEFDYFSWVILPILIFLARLGDVTMATLRHIFISKGFKKIVPILGFFEVLIWLVAMRQVFSHLDNAACFIAWALGFSAGTYLGMLIDERLAMGMQIIRIITNEDISGLKEVLKNNQQGITIIDAEGAYGPVKVIFTIVKRINKFEVIELIHKHAPNAFYSIEDVKSLEHGVFSKNNGSSALSRLFSFNNNSK
jgi:uncharacterized protein YebE (UPF0316 family)